MLLNNQLRNIKEKMQTMDKNNTQLFSKLAALNKRNKIKNNLK